MPRMPIGLAPMHGVTTFPSRLWFYHASQFDFCSTPFLRVTQGFPAEKISPFFIPEILSLKHAARYKATPQLMASSPRDFVRIAQYLLQFTHEVELNCGCPSPTVFGNGAGSSLLAETDKFRDFVRFIVDELGPNVLSVKMRTGIDDPGIFEHLVDALADISCKRVVVHGRTKKAGYAGLADWDLINLASERMPYPVRGSGDIMDWRHYSAREASWKCESVIIGRGALRNPWIFGEIKESRSFSLDKNTLYWSLAVWLMLHEGVVRALELEKPQSFLETASYVLESSECGVEAEKWQAMYERLSERVLGSYQDPSAADVTARAMGHLKMLWNYLRSGLPEEYFTLPVLRARTSGEFFDLIKIDENVRTKFSMSYQPQFDWIYSGRRQDQKKAPPRGGASENQISM